MNTIITINMYYDKKIYIMLLLQLYVVITIIIIIIIFIIIIQLWKWWFFNKKTFHDKQNLFSFSSLFLQKKDYIFSSGKYIPCQINCREERGKVVTWRSVRNYDYSLLIMSKCRPSFPLCSLSCLTRSGITLLKLKQICWHVDEDF